MQQEVLDDGDGDGDDEDNDDCCCMSNGAGDHELCCEN